MDRPHLKAASAPQARLRRFARMDAYFDAERLPATRAAYHGGRVVAGVVALFGLRLGVYGAGRPSGAASGLTPTIASP